MYLPGCLDTSSFLSHEWVCSAQSWASFESHPALFSAMLFLLLFHCLNTHIDSPFLSESSVSPSVCLLSVCHSAGTARKPSPSLCTRTCSVSFDGNIQSPSSCCEVTSFPTILIRTISQLLQMHSEPGVIGNAMKAWCQSKCLHVLGFDYFCGGVFFLPLSLSLFLFHVLLRLPLLLLLVLSVRPSSLACAMWRKVVLRSAHVGSIRDESTPQW